MTDERQTRELDLPTYLARIDYHRPLHPAARTLADLHRAHVAAIPSENLDVLPGRGISVAPDRVPAKLLTSRRGGYGYEHGVLFAAVLARLGYCAGRLPARIGDKGRRTSPSTHPHDLAGAGRKHPGRSGGWPMSVPAPGSSGLCPGTTQARRSAKAAGHTSSPKQETTGSYASASPANGQPSTASPRNLSTPPTSRSPTPSPRPIPTRRS